MKFHWLNKNTTDYGIVNVSVANLRLQPIYQSELVNQIILGTIVPVFEEQNDFYYIQNWDGYLGWINKHTFILGNQTLAEEWQGASRVMAMENYGLIRKNDSKESEVIRDLVPCAIMKRLDSNSNFTRVELPDGQTGFVESSIIVDEKTQLNVKATQEDIVSISKRFLGIPYFWGGTSAKGFDCSGFVQTVFRLLNISLPRDAKKMIEIGREIHVEKNFNNLEVGDLLFFGKTLKRITHVAISFGGELFIHSEGCVKVNSLNPDHPAFNEYRRNTFLRAKKIL